FGKNFFTDLMAFSLGAQLGVLPILLYHFGRVSLTGIGANLLGVPLAGVLVATGIGGLVLPLAWLNEFLVLGIAGVARFFAALPGAQIETPPLRLLPIFAGYALLLMAIFSAGARDASALQLNRANGFQSEMRAALDVELRRWWNRQRTRLPRPQSVLVLAIFFFTCYCGFRFYA